MPIGLALGRLHLEQQSQSPLSDLPTWPIQGLACCHQTGATHLRKVLGHSSLDQANNIIGSLNVRAWHLYQKEQVRLLCPLCNDSFLFEKRVGCLEK